VDLRNVGILSHYTASQPSKPRLEISITLAWALCHNDTARSHTMDGGDASLNNLRLNITTRLCTPPFVS
jgi:hypothetical protein